MDEDIWLSAVEKAYLALSEVHKGERRHKGPGLNRQM